MAQAESDFEERAIQSRSHSATRIFHMLIISRIFSGHSTFTAQAFANLDQVTIISFSSTLAGLLSPSGTSTGLRA
jgi:hypothetical protein